MRSSSCEVEQKYNENVSQITPGPKQRLQRRQESGSLYSVNQETIEIFVLDTILRLEDVYGML